MYYVLETVEDKRDNGWKSLANSDISNVNTADDLESPLKVISGNVGLNVYRINISNSTALSRTKLSDVIRDVGLLLQMSYRKDSSRSLVVTFAKHVLISQKRCKIGTRLPKITIGSHMWYMNWAIPNDLEWPLKVISCTL